MSGPSAVTVSRSAGRLLNLSARPVTKIGIIGVFERGVLGQAVECADYDAWQKAFGAYSANAQQAPLGVRALFAESAGDTGGAGSSVRVYGVRVVHSSTPANIATKTSVPATVTLQTASLAATAGSVTSSVGPWKLDNAYTLVVAFETGGNQTFPISAAAASRQSADGTFNVDTGDGYNIRVGAITEAWTIQAGEVQTGGAATATELKNSLNAFFASKGMQAVASVASAKVVVTTNQKGTGALLNFVSAIVNGANIGFTTGVLNGTGNVADANIVGVTAAEWVTIMTAITNGTATDVGGALKLTSATTGGSSTAQVVASSTADTAMGFDNAIHTGTAGGAVNTLQVDASSDGVWGNSYSVKVAAASNGQSAQFNLQVLKGTVIVESFTNLSMTDTDANYVESVINVGVGSQPASTYIRVTDLDAALASPSDLPATGTFALTTGADGLTSIADADYVGGVNADGLTAGLSCFDAIPDLDVIVAPDRATASFINSLITYNNSRSTLAFLIFELPHGNTYAQARTFQRTTAALIGTTERAADYWPEVYVENPDTTVFGNAATVIAPISGLLAGLYARVDAAKDGGASTSPGGTPLRLRTAKALANDAPKNPTLNGLLYDDLINPINVVKVGPTAGAIYVDGTKTLNAAGAFPWVGQSRGITFLEHQIGIALDAIRHANNTEALRSALKAEITEYLRGLLAVDFFSTRVEALAFSVNCSNALNSVAEQAAGRLHVKIGAAMAAPGEFIFLNFYPLVGQAV